MRCTLNKMMINKEKIPDWLGDGSLHDARVLSISKLESDTDPQTKKPQFPCLEITLDAGGSYRPDVVKIRFYNYQIKHKKLNLEKIGNLWWYGDSCKMLPSGDYLMEINFVRTRDDDPCLHIQFEYAEVDYIPKPDWYWNHEADGALVQSIRELLLDPDEKSQTPATSCLEITFQYQPRHIYKIRLLDYQIIHKDLVDLNSLKERFWLTDEIRTLSDDQYELKIVLTGGRYNLLLQVRFRYAEIERNQ